MIPPIKSPPTNRPNHHCTCVKIGSTGIMIEGRSGAGKTSLALGLLNAARIRGAAFALVCDDQALLDIKGRELWATAPKSIAGKVELFGAGIADIKYLPQCRIDLVCELIDQNDIERFAENTKCDRLGISIDYVQAPIRHEAQGIRILLQKLSLPL